MSGMMMERSMARKRGRSPKRRSYRRNKAISLRGTAETLIIGDAATKALFGMGVIPFFTEGWLTPQSQASINSWQLSAAELVKGLVPGGASYGMSGEGDWTNNTAAVGRAMMKNLRANGAQSVAVAVVTPILFRMFGKTFRKPINAINRQLKNTGVRV